MRKIIVFQHVAHEILGTLNPLLKSKGFRVRYVNFDRNPNEAPSLEKYNGLIVLGGNMGVYEAEKYTHIKVELKLIEQALSKNIPILGICLGAQMLAQVLGSHVRKSDQREIGWCEVMLTQLGAANPLLNHFKPVEKVFQMHGDTFDIPQTAQHLASSTVCQSQAFCYGGKAFGLQFHLEVDKAMIYRWLNNPSNLEDLESYKGGMTVEQIKAETEQQIAHSLELSAKTFSNFVKLFALKERSVVLGSGHEKPRK